MRLCHGKTGRRRLQVAGVLLTSLLAVAQAFAQPQTAGRGKPAWPPSSPAPKNAEGNPDISGAWAPNAIRQNVDMVGSGVEVPCRGPKSCTTCIKTTSREKIPKHAVSLLACRA